MAKSKLSLGCLFWIALVLLVIVIILANLKTANEIIDKTGFNKFVENLFSGKPVTASETETPEKRPAPTESPVLVVNDPDDPDPRSEDQEPTASPKSVTSEPNIKPTQTPAVVKPDPTKTPVPAKPNVRNAKIFLVDPNNDGTTSIRGFARNVRFKDEPLRETINTLLSGPTASEGSEGYLSAIPEKTRLLDVYVKKDVAYLDFNESFRFNPRGIEGQKAAISQLVYTCTEFTNVTSVLFIIEGKNTDYLGPEGIFIGKPLTREDCLKL